MSTVAMSLALCASLSAPVPMRVACVGDSITFGAGIEGREWNCYPAQLGALLGAGWDVRNFGVSGSTILRKGNVPYWRQPAYAEALAFEPNIVVIALGTNDSKPGNWAHESDFVGDCRDLIASFRELPSHPRILLCQPPAAFSEQEISGRRIAEEVCPRLVELAFELGIEIIDLHQGFLAHADLLPDGVHPNAFGAEAIARHLAEVIAFEEAADYDLEGRLAEAHTVGSFHGYRELAFTLEGVDCRIVRPRRVAVGHPWIWRPAFHGYEPQADIALLERGFHVAYCDITNLFGTPVAMAIWDSFYALARELELSPRPVLEGISRGGLAVHNWAIRHPECVGCIFGNTPVLDIRSWPGGKGAGKGSPGDWQDCLSKWALTEEQAATWAGNPVDNARALVAAGIPMIHYVGLADEVVPPAENTDVFERHVRELGGAMTVIRVPGMNHHPPAYNTDDYGPIVDFLLRAMGRKANSATAACPSAEFRGAAAGWGGGTWHDQFEALNRLARERAGEIHVLFLGDSITQGWTGSVERMSAVDGTRAFDRSFGRLGAASFGLSGDRTEHVLYRVRSGNLDPLDPDTIVLMIGVNNLWGRHNTGEEIAEGTAAILKELRARKPRARVILLGCFPTGAPDSWERQQVERLHEGVARLADGQQVRYLDLRPLFLTPEGELSPTTMNADGVHISDEGYEAWGKALAGELGQ